MLGILYFAWFADGAPWHAAVFWQAVLAVVLTMIAVCFALPQLLYRRTSGHWLLPLVPLLRLLALVARPCVAMLAFFQSLIDLTDDDAAADDEPDSGGEHRSADLRRHRRGPDRGGRPQADPIRGGVRR